MNRVQMNALALAVSLGFSADAMAENMSNADYSTAKDKIAAEYKSGKAACNSLSANAKDVCVAQAKGVQKVARADLDASYKPSTKAHYEALVAKAETRAEPRAADRRAEPWPVASAQPAGDFPAPLPAQPKTNNGIGQGIIGSVPASASNQPVQTTAYADPSRGAPPTTLGAQAAALQTSTVPQQPIQQAALAAPAPQPTQTIQHNGAIKAAARSGWIIQVGALETESEARQRLNAARGSASKLLSDAEQFTETVSKGNKTLYRARFAGLNQDSAEAACRTLKRSDISCIAIRN